MLGAVAESAHDFVSYAGAGIRLLPQLVASETTTLSVCDLVSGRREIVAHPQGRIGAAERECFDRFFTTHPLVRYHAFARGRGVHRISDSTPSRAFATAPCSPSTGGSASTTSSPCRSSSTTARSSASC